MLSVHRRCVKLERDLRVLLRMVVGDDARSIVQFLKVSDISTMFEEEFTLPTALILRAAYFAAPDGEGRVMQARKPSNAAIDWLSNIPGQAGEASLERHFSVGELATLWDLSEQTIRRMFTGEPGVIEWGHTESRFKRGYITMRIPESVVQRVHCRLRSTG